MERNLTSGSVWKNIFYFSLPYLLSYFLQTLYGMADLFIIGQFEGVAGTTAVSIGSQVMHMLTVMIVGLAMGSTVSIAKAIGANDKKEVSRSIGNTVTLFMLVAAGLMVILLCLAHPIVSVMSTPAEAVSGTVTYLTICFIGIPFITAYNIISSIFRGLGDSKSPMYFIAVACVTNIVLVKYLSVPCSGTCGSGTGNNFVSGSQCSDRACGNSEKEYRDLCFEKGLQATAPCDGTDSQDRDSGSHAGRADPDCIYHYHDHCKPPWFK